MSSRAGLPPVDRQGGKVPDCQHQDSRAYVLRYNLVLI